MGANVSIDEGSDGMDFESIKSDSPPCSIDGDSLARRLSPAMECDVYIEEEEIVHHQDVVPAAAGDF